MPMVFFLCFPPNLVVRDKGIGLRLVSLIITKERLLESQNLHMDISKNP